MSELNEQPELIGKPERVPAGRIKTFRRAALGLVVVAALAAGGIAIANEVRLAPLRVTGHKVSLVPGPLQVAANESIPASAPLEATETVVEDTADFAFSFTQTLESARDRIDKKISSKNSPSITAVADECLSTWATEHLREYAGTSQYDVIIVCGRATAIVVGSSGVDDRVLVYGAIQKDAPENVTRVRSVLIDSKATQMAFASARSSDASTVLMVAAALPEPAAVTDATTAAEADTAVTDGKPKPPPVLNVRPPGVKVVPND
jgi:hypothetical protein